MMTITSAMFDTPKSVYQSTNINHIASQGRGSLLVGGELVKLDTLTNTVTSTYGITDNQSDKLSSGYSVNIPAQSSAKVSAGQSAKFYAGFSGETLSYPNPDIPNRVEITPFEGFPVVTTRGRIEFLQSIKKGSVEFLESIKKGSVSATLCVFDIKYRANQYGDFSLNLRYSKYQPFASMPKRSSSLRQAALTHELNDVSAEAILTCSNRSSSNRICFIVLPERSNAFFSFLSCIGNYHGYNDYEHGNYHNAITQWLLTKKTMPRSASTLTGHLITTDNEAIEVTMNKHITPLTGRNSLTPSQSFRWLFLALERGNPAAIPHRIEATAPNEQSARLLLVRDYILSFAGRLPVREVAV